MLNDSTDLSGVMNSIFRAESRIRDLENRTSDSRNMGKVQVIVPSGVAGFNAVFEVMGEQHGNIESDISSISPFTAFLNADGNMIILNGILVKTVVPYATMTIEGLNSSLPKTAGTKVWLEVEIDNALKATKASIKSGSSWPPYAEYIGASPYTQTKATCRIGMVVSGELPQGTPGFSYSLNDVALHFLQQVSTNLCIMACAIDGKATMLPLPFAG
jgi:hypothetical protein